MIDMLVKKQLLEEGNLEADKKELLEKDMIELRAKKILKMKELNAPKVLIENEYRLFFEKAVELLNIYLTKEEIEELYNSVTDFE